MATNWQSGQINRTGAAAMLRGPKDSEPKRDWRISVTLAAVWLIAMAIVLNRGTDIPLSMLVMATIFFVLLIPAMNDLVRNIERASSKHDDISEK